MANEDPKSTDEIKLREWLSANEIYPGNEDMQSMVINSFYSQFEEEPADEDLIPLDEVDLDALGLADGFDYRAYQNSDEDEDQEWERKVTYSLNNFDRLLVYINEMWR